MGTALPAHSKPTLTREHLKAYAEASGDHNPIHLNEAFAKEAGFKSVIAHGMLSMAFLGDYIRKNFPESQFTLKRFRVRFKKITFPGDTLTCQGTLKENPNAGELVLVLQTLNQNLEITTEGEAHLIER